MCLHREGKHEFELPITSPKHGIGNK